jgi:hypothetical protein
MRRVYHSDRHGASYATACCGLVACYLGVVDITAGFVARPAVNEGACLSLFSRGFSFSPSAATRAGWDPPTGPDPVTNG